MQVYLDNSATTRCYDEVIKYMTEIMEDAYGNPSSMHMMGVDSEKYVKEARTIIANSLKVKDKEILFTSGGTESDNMALIGACRANKRAGNHIITTKIEHPAILETCKYLESEGYEVTYLDVDEKGRVSTNELKNVLCENTILVSVMHTNNEIGAVEPLEEIGKIIKQYNPNILFHVDAVQGFGKYQIRPKQMNIDMLSASSHKIHGPKGVGFLYINEKVKIQPIVFGGGQQKGLRSGTENVPGIAGMAKAVELIYKDFGDKTDRLYELKKYFVEEVLKIDGVRQVNGVTDDLRCCAPHIVSVSFEDIRAEVMLHSLEDKGIYVSAGSACASNKPAISATLKAIKLSQELLDRTIRFSFSTETTKEEIEYTLEQLRVLLPILRKYVRK